MTHRIYFTRTPLTLSLVALALLHPGTFAPQPRVSQNPVLPAPVSPVPPAPVLPVQTWVGYPIDKVWLLDALRARGLGEEELVRQVEERKASFVPTAEDEKELRAAGAADRLLEAVRKNYRQPGAYVRGGGMAGGGGAAVGRGGFGGTGPVDYTRPFRQNEVTRKSVITFMPKPGYTKEAHNNNVYGVVRLRAVLNFSGEVTNITVVKGLPDGLTEKAIAAARRIRFRPAEKDGREVSQYVVLEYNFNAFDYFFDEQEVTESAVTFDKNEVDERAVILKKPEAEYTKEARRNNVRGKVVLKVTLTDDGSVVVESVEAGLPHGLTEKAIEAARRIKFEPARLGGRAVPQRATVEYVFAP